MGYIEGGDGIVHDPRVTDRIFQQLGGHLRNVFDAAGIDRKAPVDVAPR